MITTCGGGNNNNNNNVQSMIDASQLFIGYHNFIAFRGAPKGNSNKIKFAKQNTHCHIIDISITTTTTTTKSSSSSTTKQFQQEQQEDEDITQFIRISITADRFLYKMIRFIVGCLVSVGKNQLNLNDIHDMLITGKRPTTKNKKLICAPPEGLFLKHVHYKENINWKIVNQ